MKKILLNIILVIIFTIPAIFAYYVWLIQNNWAIISDGKDFKKYYIADYLVEFQKDETENTTYISIGLALEKPFSFRHLYLDHWWEGIVGTYLKIEDDEIVESIVYIEATEDKKIFDATITTEVLNEKEIIGLYVNSLENSEGQKIEYYLRNVDLSTAQENKLLDQEYSIIRMTSLEAF